MNTKYLFAAINIITMIAAVIVLCTAWNTTLLFSAFAIITIETVILFWFTLDLIGRIKPYVYQFEHLQNNVDKLQDKFKIFPALESEEINELMKQQKTKRLSNMFKNGVLIESSEPLDLNDDRKWKMYKGYVYASNINEANTILINYQFSDPDSEDNK